MPQVVIVGYYGYGNAGDEALLTCLLAALPPDVTPLVLSGDPIATSQAHGVKAINRWDGRAIGVALAQSVGFIWGGGSLMQDRTSWRSPLYYGSLMLWAQRCNLKTIAWAQGLGPLERRWCRWLTRTCLRGCTAVTVRDSASAALLDRWQIAHLQAPDPVWALPQSPESPRLQRIAVNLRPHPELTPQRQVVIAAALVRLQQRSGAVIAALPFQDRDREVLARVMPPGAEWLTTNPLQALATVRLAIAMRLHAVIRAAATATPLWGLSYDPKVSQVLQAYGLPGLALTELPTDPEALAQQWYASYQAQRVLTGRDEVAIKAQQHGACLGQLSVGNRG